MLISSISSTVARPTRHAEHFMSLAYSASRFSSGRFLESSMPRGNLLRSRMHAPATTGPASGAQPASSTPASGCGKSSSNLKVQLRGIAPEPMAGLSESPVGRRNICGLVHPPRREAAGFAGFVEEDDVAVGIAEARLAPHPRLVAGSMLERDSAPSKLFDAVVEIVAFQINGGGRDDFFFGVDLHREGRSAGRLEPRIVRRIVDDLLQTQRA